MTKTEDLQLVRDFWDAKQMKYLKPGDPLPEDEKLVQRMRELGYLKTQKEIRAQRNPEAAQAVTQVEQLEADLAQAQAKVTELQAKVAEFEGQQGGGDSAQTLQTRLQEAVDELGQQKQQRQEAEMGRDKAQKALAEYQAAVGDLLPEGLTAPVRKALIAKRYVGKALISLLTDDQLNDVDGVAQGTVDKLREWAPFAGVVPAEPESGGDVEATDPGAEQ